MKTRRTLVRLIITAAALFLLGTTIAGLNPQQDSPVTRVQICVKDNGQLRMLIGNNTSCEPSERQMEWVVGGAVTDIQPGQGLVGSREDGTVRLALDPAVLAGCTDCRGGRMFAGFNDGPVQIPYVIFSENLPDIAELALPAGDYVIFAKLTLETSFNEFSIQRPVTCRLTAGSNFDESKLVLEHIHSDQPGNPDGSNIQGLTLQVVHRFDAPGRVALSAGYGGTLMITPQVQYRNLKIMAIEVSSISNLYLGGN